MAQVKRSWPEERKRVHAIGDGYDDEYEVRAAEIVADKPVNCPSLVRARGGKGERPNAFGQLKWPRRWTPQISQEHGDNSNTNAAASQADDVATHPNSSAAINKGKQSIVQDARGVAADTETVAREQGKRQVLNKRIGALYDGRFKRHWSFRNRGVAAGRLAATEIEESNDSNARGVDMSLQSHLEALAGLDYPKRLRSVVQRVPATERPLANVLAEQWRRAVHPRNPWPLTRTQKKKILMHI
ncbi:hypothetical protein CRG98_003907 [Punica granatum]|uniref:Uncharacterized protein n=1 Tax=Punica granatum TaxID=22663 RepID=A0A2I0L4M6_PUNGR|nr:hypothetical protein CRG98_003907 [Punica granatum]